jgi:hypothetical protein
MVYAVYILYEWGMLYLYYMTRLTLMVYVHYITLYYIILYYIILYYIILYYITHTHTHTLTHVETQERWFFFKKIL